jgi:hypothetical protein
MPTPNAQASAWAALNAMSNQIAQTGARSSRSGMCSGRATVDDQMTISQKAAMAP